MKILIADDDLELRELLNFALRQAGYLVIQAADGVEALQRFEEEHPDLVILDVNMPHLNGFEVCRRIRAERATPVMLLTVRNSEEDQVHGLDLGADDYLTKPFSPRTLKARVRALLRRSEVEPRIPEVAGDLRLDFERHVVSVRASAPIQLTKLEFRLMQYLLANAEHTVTSEQLTMHIWGYRGIGDRHLLKQLVHRVRLKIEQNPAEPRYLVTVPGTGYLFQPTG